MAHVTCLRITTILLAHWLGACTLTDTVIHNVADLDDHRIFANRHIAAAAVTSPLRSQLHAAGSLRSLQVPDEDGRVWRLDDYLDHTRTAALVVLHEDQVVMERYARGYDETSLLNSFSIAKAVIGTLVGIAVAEGRITDLDASVADYRPEFGATPYGAVTLRELLTMTSGMGDVSSLLPGRAHFYYGKDLHATTESVRPEAGAAKSWRYSEGDVQMLAFVLEAATGMPVSAYLAQKLWTPLGMEHEALWSLDRPDGVEKAFCCLSARARDFARLGRLFLDGGRSNGRQLVPAEWAARSVLPGHRTEDGYVQRHLWWTPQGGQGDYFAYGHNGQYLYVNPTARVVIVKFSETRRQDPVPMFRALSMHLSHQQVATGSNQDGNFEAPAARDLAAAWRRLDIADARSCMPSAAPGFAANVSTRPVLCRAARPMRRNVVDPGPHARNPAASHMLAMPSITAASR